MPVEAAQTSQLKAFKPSDQASASAMDRFRADGDAAGKPDARPEALSEARKRMAFVKRSAPLVLAVIHRPGLDGDEADKIVALKRLFGATKDASTRLASVLAPGVANPGWLLSQIEAGIADWLSTQWGLHGKASVDAEIDALLATFPDTSDLQAIVGNEEVLNEQAALVAGLRMSIIKASASLISEVMIDASSDSVPDIFCVLQDEMLSRAARTPMPAGLDAVTRLSLMQNALSAGGRLMTSIYAKESAAGGQVSADKVLQTWRAAMDSLDRMVELQVGLLAPQLAAAAKPESTLPQP